MTGWTDDARSAELAERLAAVRDRVAAACGTAGRDPGEVTLIAVTKTFPAEDVARLVRLGVHDVGENRDQEAGPKVAEAAQLLGERDFRLHFIGQLQSNKAGHVARYADHVHSVDRGRLVTSLSRAAENAGRELGVLVQVALDDDPGRGGAAPSDVAALCDLVDGATALRLDGLMAVAPLGGDPGAAFARLAELSASIREDHPGATWVSAGMSADLEAAIAHGATHLRVGTAILHSRTPHR
jgi:pyridoxal phosphate enzyme (YggS family)